MSATMELPATKRCTKCGEVKELELFKNEASKATGKGSVCRSCDNARCARYRAENPEKFKESQFRYVSTHKKILKQNARAKHINTYGKNREKLIARAAKWASENSDKVKVAKALYASANRDRLRVHEARYRARKKAMREFFKMHRAMHAIAETLNQMKP